MNWDTMREFTPVENPKGHERKKPAFISDDDIAEERVLLGISEMDRVLGGGLTIGSAVLLGGDPGIGKTTLSFEVAAKMISLGLKVLYVSGEESLKQLGSRMKRLQLGAVFPILTTNHLDDILAAASEEHYDLIVIDSIQSVYNPRLPMLPGSVSQIKDVSTRLTMELKAVNTTMIVIGHVTKEGAIAGPKILEHTVDTVLYFEGDKMLPYRMLRAIKNRYGPVDEVGIFQMTREGLVSVENPSQFFMSERDDIAAGSTLYPCMSGSRPIIIEVQAITAKTNFSMPRRLSLGYDANRLFVLISVIEKAIGKSLFDRDIYVNITGGIKVSEPGIDLCIAASILSSYKDANIGQHSAFFGEVGLTGEVRKIVYMDSRIKEAQRLGIKRVFVPRGVEASSDMEIIPVRNVKELSQRME